MFGSIHLRSHLVLDFCLLSVSFLLEEFERDWYKFLVRLIEFPSEATSPGLLFAGRFMGFVCGFFFYIVSISLLVIILFRVSVSS